MNRKLSLFLGIGMVLAGALALAGNIIGSLTGLRFFSWPLIVIAAGLAFVLPPFLARDNRGLGGLFIPGLPILTTGGILFYAEAFQRWNVWAVAWPLEVLSAAVGLLLAGLWLRVVWMAIPGFIILFTGLALQFCALTGMWHLWVALWAVIPLALGLAFLLIAAVKRSRVFLWLGVGFSGFAALMGGIMALVLLSSWKFFGIAWSALIILAGGALLVLGLVRRTQPDQAAAS
ncbi:MAG: hypothetical protein JW726_19940 [Anaerolineales bacterium]|nr:hypothetical protein [Anaerolineales bacterium]